jgi:hypothetical protein
MDPTSAVGNPRTRRRTVGGVLRLVVGVLVTTSIAVWMPPSARGQATAANPAKVAELKMNLRALYADHVFWVRDLVIATRLGVKGAASEADEYGLANAKAIGQSIAPVYGQAAAAKFTSLFVGHYQAVKGYMRAAFANGFRGNPAMKKAATDELQRNGKAIALFVSSANPNLPDGAVYGLLVSHVQHHIMEIDAVAKEDWSAEADDWGPMIKQVYSLSDALADGIAKQFPDKFQ